MNDIAGSETGQFPEDRESTFAPGYRKNHPLPHPRITVRCLCGVRAANTWQHHLELLAWRKKATPLAHTYSHSHPHIHMQTHTHSAIHVNKHSQVHMYTRAQPHTQTHKHTHIYLCLCTHQVGTVQPLSKEQSLAANPLPQPLP